MNSCLSNGQRYCSSLAVCMTLLMAASGRALACAVRITAPANGAHVSGSVPISLSESSCGGNYNRLEVSGPGTIVFHKDFQGTTYSWNTVGLPDGTYNLYVTAWSTSSYLVLLATSGSISVGVSNGTSTPTPTSTSRSTATPSATPTPAPTPTVTGATYYIDSVAGNDSNNGTSTSTPWRTLAKVQALLNGGVAPGTGMLFKKGDTWTASSSNAPMLNLSLALNGTSSNPIVFGSYGSGALPVFDGNGGTATACFFANGGSGGSPYLSHVTVSGIECRNTRYYGVYFHNYNSTGGLPGVVVQNMNVHNTGPGAFAGASSSNSCGSTPCDDGQYHNQLMFLDESYQADGTRFLNNVVDTCGGHNCIQLQGDMGAPLIQGNTCFSWVHNCIDVKRTANAMVKGNTVHNGTAGSAYYYENDNSPANGSITWAGNVAYSAPNGIECENGTPTQHTASCKAYNNTLYLGGESAIVSASKSGLTWDVRNNILDTTDPIYVCGSSNSNSCHEITIWDYNDDGGTHGFVNTAVVGPHDLTGSGKSNNPLYVNAAAADFHLQSSSPCLKAGDPTLIGNPDMGAF
jgi:hypothetical protein